MLSIIAFIVVIFGSINWLAIGFFQYDLVAGLFGYQGSIFSRIVYIIVGICAIYLVYSVIRNKGKISVKKLVKQEKMPFQNNDKTTNNKEDQEIKNKDSDNDSKNINEKKDLNENDINKNNDNISNG